VVFVDENCAFITVMEQKKSTELDAEESNGRTLIAKKKWNGVAHPECSGKNNALPSAAQ